MLMVIYLTAVGVGTALRGANDRQHEAKSS